MQNSNEAMREALKELQSRLVAGVYDGSIDCHEALEVVEKALALPRRQCDVGTAEEQAKRLNEFCASHGEAICGSFRCERCALLWAADRCELAWAQMPYEEGDN